MKHAPTSKTPPSPPSVRSAKEAVFNDFSGGKTTVFEAIGALDRIAGDERRRKKLEGAIYTPEPVAREMASFCEYGPKTSFWEPSCGRGIFVFSILLEAKKRLGLSPEELSRWAGKNLRASELDSEACDDLRRLWRIFFLREKAPTPALRLICEDSLFGIHAQSRHSCVIGNPPYVRIQNLPKAYRARLRSSFSSCENGNVDLYCAFVELALKSAERVCLITPNSWMASAMGKPLRSLLIPRLERLMDFKDRLLFAPVRAYCSIFTCAPQTSSSPDILWRLNFPSEAGAWKKAKRNDPVRFSAKKIFLGSPAPAGAPLFSLALIRAGVATLADAAYLHEGHPESKDSIDGFRAPDGSFIEKSASARFFKLTKLKTKADLLASKARIVCPYEGENFQLMDSAQFRKHKGAHSFLKKNSALLAGRDRGEGAQYPAWFMYGRAQGLHGFAPGEKLLFIPALASGPLRPIETTRSEIGERFLFVSGFCLRAKTPALHGALLSFLESPEAWKQLLAQGRALAGKKPWRSFGAKTLGALAIPPSFLPKAKTTTKGTV